MLKYKYPCAIIPPNSKDLAEELEEAAARLSKKLSNFKKPEEPISPFIEEYFKSNLNYLQASLQRYTFLLTWALAPFALKNFNEIVLIDYGGGSGLISLLAKEAGIGTVIYVDLYDVCCHDAEKIAQSIGLKADHYVNGDIDGLLFYLRENGLGCNALVSYDTLEHIYDIEDFFDKISGVSDGDLSLMLASGANPYNYLINRRLMKLQRKVEHEGKIRQYKEDVRNPEESFVSIRKKIITQHHSSLKQAEIDLLAHRTRGMRREDILEAAESFLGSGKLLPEPDHLTNTCDPLTGNWCERLLNPHDLGIMLSRSDFSVKVFSGYYGSAKKDFMFKRVARYLANFLIFLSSNLGLRISPYYCIYAYRRDNKLSSVQLSEKL